MSSNIGLFVNPKSGFVGIGTSRPATALHVEGNMLAAGTITASNLSILGDFVTLNTITSNTEQMVIQNAGTGPALKVTQTGANSIAEFYDDGNALAFKIADGGNVGIGTANPLQKLHVNGDVTITSTGALTIPRGTTAQRPANPVAGMIRYNNTEGYIETYEAILNQWISISTFIGVLATGGSVTEILSSGIQYRVHTFTTVGTSSFQVLRGGEVEYLIVAGGGGGGKDQGGGGGAGGLLQGKINISVNTYSVVVGGGGAGRTTSDPVGRGTSGTNSVFAGITTLGGGGAGAYIEASDTTQKDGLNGGSGGGGGNVNTAGVGGLGTSGQGNNGGNAGDGIDVGGGGGGGAGSAGAKGRSSGTGIGGNGLSLSISGTAWFYAGGGGGGSGNSIVVSGGAGGGGSGSTSDSTAGSANTGGGGGGCRNGGAVFSSNGGSGIVIVRYLIG